MTLRAALLPLPLLLLAGCATFDQAQLGRMRSDGVPPSIVAKLGQNRPLQPQEVASLSRHGVSAEALVRYIHRTGVPYLLTPEDSRQLRAGGVPLAVIDALAEEGASFAQDYGTRGRRRAGMSMDDPYVTYPDPNGFEW